MSMTRQEQLDAVVRNYVVWKSSEEPNRAALHPDTKKVYFFSYRDFKGDKVGESYLFTLLEVEQRKAELQNKPSWDDAPKWAESHTQESDGSWYWWNIGSHKLNARNPYKDFWTYTPFGRPVKCEKASKGEVVGDWRDTLEDRPEPETTDEKRGGA